MTADASEMVERCLAHSQLPAPFTDLTEEERAAVGYNRGAEMPDRGAFLAPENTPEPFAWA